MLSGRTCRTKRGSSGHVPGAPSSRLDARRTPESAQADFIVVLAVLNVPPICEPSERAPATRAIETSATIRAYSTAVTPEVSRIKREKKPLMTAPPCLVRTWEGYVAVITERLSVRARCTAA